MSRHIFFQAINTMSYVGMVVVNGLAGSTVVLNGVTSADISDKYPTLITPAGFTFAIWGIIYALLFLFTVYQALPRNRDKSFLDEIGVLFVLSSLFNISWLFFWHYDLIVYSLVLMVGLLATLVLLYLRLDIGRRTVSLKEMAFVQLPFSVYLGWISIATIANVAVSLTSIGWDGWGIEASVWAVAIICVALILSLVVLATRKDIAFNFVVMWALLGILTKQSEHESIVFASEIGIVLLVVAIGVTVAVSKFKR